MSIPARMGTCPRCGTAYTPGQEYCLECGLRLPVQRSMFAGIASAWQRRGWYPGDWIWPVLLFLVLAGLGAIAAILLSRGSDGGGTLVATPPAVTTGPSNGGGTVAEPPTTVPTTTQAPTTVSRPPTTVAKPHALTEWPKSDGYTVVLQSVPTTAGRAGAQRTARQALDLGLPQVGVLDSSQYSSLHPGYYVVFSGIYTSQSDAAAHVADARAAGFGAAYARPITH